MEQIQNIISSSINTTQSKINQIQSLNKSTFHPNKSINKHSLSQNYPHKNNKSYSSKHQSQESTQYQCKMCLSTYNRYQNHPIKICSIDHILCQSCIDHKLFKQYKTTKNNQQIIIYICPFCQQIIDFNAFVIDYKTINSMNMTIQKQFPLKSQLKTSPFSIQQQFKHKFSKFQSLSQQNFTIIFQFIKQKDKIHLASTNIFLRSILMDGKIWGQFQLSDTINMNNQSTFFQRNWKLRLKWINLFFTVIKPYQVKIVVMNFSQDQNLLYLFINRNFKYVNQLVLYCQSMDLHLFIAKACPNVTVLNVSSNVFSDCLFEEMAKYMKNIKNFSVIKDDCNFCGQNLAKRFESGLQSIILKSHMIDFEQIAMIAYNNSQSLKQVQLDIQQCSQKILLQIIESIPNIQILRLFHMQNIHIPQKISKSLSSKVRQLYLTKTYQMPMSLIINKIASPTLMAIDFTEVNMLDDGDIQVISKSCPYLKRVNISWSPKISQSSIVLLINSCLMLQHLNLTGLKNLTDNTFSQYLQLLPYFNEHIYDQLKFDIRQQRQKILHSHHLHQANQLQLQSLSKQTSYFFNSPLQKQQNRFHSRKIQSKIVQIRTLRHLRWLICISCNNISDKMLKMIYIINRKVNVINYYSNSLGLYAKDQLED